MRKFKPIGNIAYFKLVYVIDLLILFFLPVAILFLYVFGYLYKFFFFQNRRNCKGILGVSIDEEGSLELASRSRGTPRIANRLLKRVRDFAQVRGNGTIDRRTASAALDMMEIDELGLDNIDRKMLETIITFYGGGPVGLETLAATVGEEAITIEDVYEPYLMQIGYLSRTPRGRCATRLAYEHLGLPFSEPQAKNEAANGQMDIFSQSLDNK